MQVSPRKKNESGLFREVWKEFNKLVDYTRTIAVMPSGNRGVKVQRTSNGTLLHADAGKPEPPLEPSVLERYVVSAVLDDYINCQKINNDGTVNEVRDEQNAIVYTKLAKPFNLRRAGWHTVTVAYYSDETPTALSGVVIYYNYLSSVMREARIGGPASTEIEFQVIRPAYIPNKSIIFATKVDNRTGVGGVDDDLVDINADGRAWAAVI